MSAWIPNIPPLYSTHHCTLYSTLYCTMYYTALYSKMGYKETILFGLLLAMIDKFGLTGWLMSALTNQIRILYLNLHCTVYFTLKLTKKYTHKSKWLVWLTYSTRNIPLLATCKFDLTLDSILSWTLYCILYCTLHCTLYTLPYTILFSNAKVAD